MPKVVEIVNNPVLLASDKGDKLYRHIKKALGAKPFKEITLDFEGYKFLSSTFLNHAFGQLCIDLKISEKQFFNKIKFVKLDEDDLEEVTLSVLNAQLRRGIIRKGHDEKKFYASIAAY